jgi:hypothetical protein
MEGEWIQANARGEANAGGSTTLTGEVGPLGQVATGSTVDREGNETPFRTQVNAQQRAEGLFLPATVDGRQARPRTTPGPVQEEPGLFGRLADSYNAAIFGRAHIDETRRAEFEARSRQYLNSELPVQDRGLFDRMRTEFPRDTPSATVAQATLLARQAGIRDPSDLRDVVIEGNRAAIVGSYPGSHAMLDLSARPPPVGETVQSLQAIAANGNPVQQPDPQRTMSR